MREEGLAPVGPNIHATNVGYQQIAKAFEALPLFGDKL
jgi:hypothetical protein